MKPNCHWKPLHATWPAMELMRRWKFYLTSSKQLAESFGLPEFYVKARNAAQLVREEELPAS
ncbi:MAG: hypothetical protein EXR51_04895 [Dehalococcoidia bacterium]|nr:hypothetical protein [Dehalococcoidia bacterium]